MKKAITARARLMSDKQRAALIDHVSERLDVFACVVAARKLFEARNGADPAVYDVLRKEHATRLVDAVIALVKVRS